MAGVFNQWFINPRGGYIHIAYTDSEAVRDRVMQVISEVNPAAFQPIPHAVASAMIRDGIEPVLPRPTYFDPERDDDEGEPDHTLCRVVGGCE